MSRTGDRRYQRNRRKLKRHTNVCWLCGGPIDMTLKYPDPQSFSADHVVPVARGGSNHGQLAAAHLVCNKRRATKTPNVLGDRHIREV